MILGVTGTRFGLNHEQFQVLRSLTDETAPFVREFHHGDCVGADVEVYCFLYTAVSSCMNYEPVEWNVWPATVPEHYRANAAEVFPDRFMVVHTRVAPLVRDKEIAERVDLLWAFPPNRSGKGGTWATIKYARAAGTPHIIVHRDGDVERIWGV